MPHWNVSVRASPVGTSIGTASSERSLSWPLALGAHEIEARDADGRRARTSVVVK